MSRLDHERQKSGAGDRARGHYSACAGRRKCRSRVSARSPQRVNSRPLSPFSASSRRWKPKSSSLRRPPTDACGSAPRSCGSRGFRCASDFITLARPLLERLSGGTAHETVDLSTVKKDHLVFIDQVIGSQRLRAVSAVGDTFPLYCTANGKPTSRSFPTTADRGTGRTRLRARARRRRLTRLDSATQRPQGRTPQRRRL